MARAHQDKDEAIALMRELSNQHGVKEGCRMAREQYPDAPTPTWNRWRLAAVGFQPEQEVRDDAVRARLAHEVRKTIPPVSELVPAPADVIPAQRKAIDFWRLLDELDQDATLMRDHAVTVLPDGTRKLRVPMALLNAHRMRSDLVRLALEHASIAFGIERNIQFQEVVMAAIAEVAPQVQRAIIDRLRKVQRDNEARYGF